MCWELRIQARTLALIGFATLAISACTGGKKTGFTLDGSPLRFQTADLGDPALIAEVNGLKITRAQILDKSQVLEDLDVQANDFLIGLAYLKYVEKWQLARGESAAAKAPSAVRVYLPESETSLKDILARFDRRPQPGLDIEYGRSEDGNLLAEAGSVRVTRDDIEMQHGLLQSIEQRRFHETMTQLQQQLARVLVNAEAEKRNQSLQDFVRNEILAGKSLEVSLEEVEAHLQSIGSSLADFDDAGKETLKSTLRGRKEQRAIEQYAADHLVRGPITTSVRPPRANLKLNGEWQPILGYGDAPVSVVAFTGSTCPDCPGTLKLLETIMKEHDGYLKLNLIHNFNAGDGIARLFSEASLCIDGQKRGKSIDFLNQLAGLRGQVDEHRFYEWVGANKLNVDEFKKCLFEGHSRELVNQHLAYARGVGILANPTLWIEGQLIEGVVRPRDVDRVIEQKISESGESWFSALVRRIKARFRG